VLSDHKVMIDRQAGLARQRRECATALGEFLAGLDDWDWFFHFTFRDRVPCNRGGRVILVPATDVALVERCARSGRLPPDPRIEAWQPSVRYRVDPVPPAPSWILGRVFDFFREVQRDAGRPIGFVLAEEFGRIGGRWHLHGLVTGVGHLSRTFWWHQAFTMFGRCRIEPPNRVEAAAFYAAKYAAKALGAIHFCGVLGGVDLSRIEDRLPQPGGGVDLVCSPGPTVLYRLTLRRCR
jgi:hypothetical protein